MQLVPSGSSALHWSHAQSSTHVGCSGWLSALGLHGQVGVKAAAPAHIIFPNTHHDTADLRQEEQWEEKKGRQTERAEVEEEKALCQLKPNPKDNIIGNGVGGEPSR